MSFTIGSALKAHRIAALMTVQDLAHLAQLSIASIYNAERNHPIQMRTLKKIAAGLKVSPAELIGTKKPSPRRPARSRIRGVSSEPLSHVA